jgi:fucose 4-O-acetylase-like acetyltransferase
MGPNVRNGSEVDVQYPRCQRLLLPAARRGDYIRLMKALNASASVVALLISLGEISRFWGSERFIPMAMDELLIAAALVWAAWRARSDGAFWHLAAWSAFCGFVLVLLVETADHQMHGPAKAAGPFYLAALGAMLTLGLWAAVRALRLVRRERGR